MSDPSAVINYDKLSAFVAYADVPRWVGWRIDRDGNKVPYVAGTNRKAKINDPSTWRVRGACQSSQLGIVFNGDGLCGVDFDGCRDPVSGNLTEWANKWIVEFDSYTEVSPTGTGVKVFLRASGPGAKQCVRQMPGEPIPVPRKPGETKQPQIEAYMSGRYFTVTGNHLEGTPSEIRDATAAWERLVSFMDEERPASGRARRRNKERAGRDDALFKFGCKLQSEGRSDDEIIRLMTDENHSGSELHARFATEGPLDDKKLNSMIGRVLEYAKGDPGPNEELEEMNSKYAIVRIQGKTRIALMEDSEVYSNYKVPVFQRKEDFLLFESDRWITYLDHDGNQRRVNRGRWWLSHPERRKHDGATFAPGPAAQRVGNKWNLWTGFGCEPRDGDCGLYLDHLRENICNANHKHFEYLLNWMAYAVQRPDRQGEVAVVLRGDEGTGKGTFAREFGRLFGSHFVHVSQPKHLTGDFNKHLWNCSVLFADEALFAGNRAHAPILKALITEDTLMVTPKGIDSFQARNFLHIIMASNEDWVVPAGPDARRYFVLDVSRAPIEMFDDEKFKYFDAIVRQMENGGREALLRSLLARDLTGFNVRRVPQTKALADQKVLSLDGLHRWWLAVLDRGVVWNSPFGNDVFQDWSEFCATQLLYESYKQWHRDTRSSFLQTEEQMAIMLGQLYPRRRPRGRYPVRELERPDQDLAQTEQAVVWKERPPGFQFGDLSEARLPFARKYGLGDRWEGDDLALAGNFDKELPPIYFVRPSDPVNLHAEKEYSENAKIVRIKPPLKKATRKVVNRG